MELNWQFVLTFLVWVPVGIWIYTVLSWMIMNDIDTGPGILGIGAALGLGMATSFAPNRDIIWLPFTLSVLTILIYPLVNDSWRKYQLHLIEVDQIDSVYERLRFNRGDVYGRIRLSEKLYEQGIRHPAIALLDGALKGQPKDLFQNELNHLANWKRDLNGIPVRTEALCFRCGHLNKLGDCFCTQCGAEFLLDLVRRRWVGFTGWGILFTVWGLLGLAVGTAPFLLSDQVTPTVRIGIGIGAISLAIISLIVVAMRGVGA